MWDLRMSQFWFTQKFCVHSDWAPPGSKQLHLQPRLQPAEVTTGEKRRHIIHHVSFNQQIWNNWFRFLETSFWRFLKNGICNKKPKWIWNRIFELEWNLKPTIWNGNWNWNAKNYQKVTKTIKKYQKLIRHLPMCHSQAGDASSRAACGAALGGALLAGQRRHKGHKRARRQAETNGKTSNGKKMYELWTWLNMSIWLRVIFEYDWMNFDFFFLYLSGEAFGKFLQNVFPWLDDKNDKNDENDKKEQRQQFGAIAPRFPSFLVVRTQLLAHLHLPFPLALGKRSVRWRTH